MAKKENVKKPLYKKWWFWVIVVCLVGAIGSSLSGGSDADKSADPSTAQTEPHAPVQNQETVETPKPHPVESTPESDPVETMPEAEGQNGNASDGTNEPVSKEYQNALAKAKSYSDMMNMSKQGIYDQLVSEYGENFPPDAAQYAIDHLEADYKANALAKAKTYYEEMSMSKAAVRDQLISEYGEQFTEEEADYAIEHLDD